MTDDRPRGSCVISGCPRDPYRREDGRLPMVCGPHVSQAEHMLREMPGLVKDLEDKDAPEEVTVRAEVRERLVGWTAGPDWHPPLTLAAVVQVEQLVVAGALPAAAVGGAARGGPVSGSPVRRLPIDVDAVDLLAPARTSTAASAALAYPEQDADQHGFLSVASMLDSWALDLADHRGERRPAPSVTLLARWLADRMDEAADDWYPIDEFYGDLLQAYNALRGQLRRYDVPDHKAGVPCPRCYAQRLVQKGGEILIRCLACPAVLLESEYHEHVATLARKVTRVKVKATLSIDGAQERPCSLQITTHMVDVSSLAGETKPDMEWTLVDGAGHFHAWAHDSTLPTLEERSVWVPYDEPDEETGGTGYYSITSHCRLCGEQIEPATVTSHNVGRQSAAGRTEWQLTFTGDAPERFSAVVRTDGRTYFGVAESAYDRGEPHPGGPGLAYGISMSWRKERAA